MPYTARKRLTRGNLSRLRSTPQKIRLDGLIKDGIWYCNCDPREEAAHLQVKKKGRNKGRYFRTCTARKCEFFLWDEDAAVRESGVTVSEIDENETPSRTKPPLATQPVQTSLSRFGFRPPPGADDIEDADANPWTADAHSESMSLVAQASDTRSRLATPIYTPVIQAPRVGDKRKRVDFAAGDDDNLFGELNSEEEMEMADAMERSSRKLQEAAHAAAGLPAPRLAPVTPSKKAVGFPGDLPTPETRGVLEAGGSFQRPNDRSSPSAGRGSAFPESSASLQITAITPGPPPSLTSSQGGGIDDDYDITAKVITLLVEGDAAGGRGVDEPVRERIREVLNAHALRIRGVVRGRDMVRSSLRKKDERIVQLQERVAALENQLRAEKDRNRTLQDGLERLRNI